MGGWPAGSPPIPTRSKRRPVSASAESSSNALEYGPAGSLASPPMTKISSMFRSSSCCAISSRCAPPATSRAARCGTASKPLPSSSSLKRRVASMPCVGEQVTATFASSGRWVVCPMAPSVGINSNLGRDSAPKVTPFRPPLISSVPAEARKTPTEPWRSSGSVRFGRLLPQVRLRRLLSRIYKGLLDDPGSDIPDVRPDRKLGPEVGVFDGHQREPYVLPQTRRPERGGDLPDLRAVIDDLQVILYVPHQGVTFDLDPDHLATDSLLRDAFEDLFADEVGLLVELHRVLQPHLVGVQERVIAVKVVVQRYVGAVAEDARLDAPDLARSDDP